MSTVTDLPQKPKAAKAACGDLRAQVQDARATVPAIVGSKRKGSEVESSRDL